METCSGLVLKKTALVNHRLGPQCLNHTRERAGGFLTMNIDITNTAPSCHITQTQVQGLDSLQSSQERGKANLQPQKLSRTWFHHSVARLYSSLAYSLWSRLLLESDAWLSGQLHPAAAGHGTHITNLFPVELPPSNTAPASIFPGHLLSFAQFSKCWENYTSSKTDFSKQGQHKDMFRQTKTNTVYYHQTLIRGTSKGYSSGKKK